MKTLGDKIQYFREKRGYSRKYVAEDICDESTLFRIEKGNHIPRLDILQSICRKLKIPVDYLLSYENETLIHFVAKIHRLCRESLYFHDYTTLQYLVEEATAFIKKNQNFRDSSFLRFIEWQKGILYYRIDRHPRKAEQTFRKLISNNKIVNELDINIANTLALLLIEMDQKAEAYQLLTSSMHVLENLPFVEDKTLFPRLGYNLAYMHYHQNRFDLCLELGYRLLNYLYSHHLHYSAGEIYHMLGIVYGHTGNLEHAREYLEHAVSIFKYELRERLYARAGRSLAEIHFQLGEKEEGRIILQKTQKICKRLADRNHLDEGEQKIEHTENQYAMTGLSSSSLLLIEPLY
ncbi:helix-turn-helix transcriptional regulator [Brevibacillus borstelensis]|jgi:transcriptional regulator with XRE-family HTH domain|uniref:helix-turn-helix transcriptional regulator n=1 Tax=Brevibacillus borstelensis TaxID=45462 RepID=UPI00046AE8BE|nr:helix-turn-helix transcriptional regulator [Brevibacillus borstelensis]MCM3621190.1 helix-turn-helix transcriptional regulator [Brevibacillus borstelensis]